MSNEIKNTAKNAPESLSVFYLYNERKDGKYTVTGLKKGIPANITVPSCVTELANFAFQGANLDSVTFENGTEIIGEYAFILSSVKEIKLPKTCKCVFFNLLQALGEYESFKLVAVLEGVAFYAF